MPQPTERDLHVDGLLSNVSIGYMNEPSSYVADVIFPVIYSDKQSDKIAKYVKSDWFRDEAGMRAPLTESAGGGFGIETPDTFYADEWAFHKDIADEDVVNADEVFDVEDDAVSYCVEKLRLSRERRWATAFWGTGIWDKDLEGQTDAPGTDEFRVWDDYTNSTPISDITDAKVVIRAATGLLPNTLIVSERTHMALKDHSDIVDRFKYTQQGVLTEQLLAKVFEIDRYIVGKALYATNAEGATDALSYILGQYDALLLYVAPRPSKRRPSAGYTVRWNRPTQNGIEGDRLESTVRRYNLPKLGGTRIECSVYEDLKLIATACGCFFHNAIAAGRTITS